MNRMPAFPVIRGIILLWFIFLIMIYFLNTVLAVRFRRKDYEKIFMAVADAALIAYYMWLHMPKASIHLNKAFDPEMGYGIPVIVIAVVAAIVAAVWLLDVIRCHLNSITPMSIREGMEKVPVGLCYYRADGQPVLTNSMMFDIGLELQNYYISDGNAFWDKLVAGALPGCRKAGMNPLYMLKDGRTVLFSRNEMIANREFVYEVVAADITEEYCIYNELENKNDRARAVNERLRTLSEQVKIMTINNEALQMKMMLHDCMGRALLTSKRYLLQPDSADPAEIISMWRECVLLLRENGRESFEHLYDRALAHAKDLGVDVHITGELPLDNNLANIIDYAVTIDASNIIKHAYGKQMFIVSEEEADGFTITFTNDGIPPAWKVSETGSLADLRKSVEALNGRMTIKSDPVFELKLMFTKGGYDGIQSPDSR